MRGSIFKRKLKSGITWGYVFWSGYKNGKRIQVFKSGFPIKDAAAKAVRVAIEQHETRAGRVARDVGPQGHRVWSYSLDGKSETKFQCKAEAENALKSAISRRETEAIQQAQEALTSAGPPFCGVFPPLVERTRQPQVRAEDARALRRARCLLDPRA